MAKTHKSEKREKQEAEAPEKRDIHSLSLALLVGLLLAVLILPIGLLALVVWASSHDNWGLVIMAAGVILGITGMRMKPDSLPKELIPSVGWLLVLAGAFGWVLSFSK